jgi:hypothetical protein
LVTTIINKSSNNIKRGAITPTPFLAKPSFEGLEQAEKTIVLSRLRLIIINCVERQNIDTNPLIFQKINSRLKN